MVLCLVATQEIHHGTYVVSHIVAHGAPRLYQANEVPAPPEGPFIHKKYLGELVQGYWTFLIWYHT